MRETYRDATRTVVWVGEAKEGTDVALEQAKLLFHAASDEERGAIWAVTGDWVQCLNEIIQRPVCSLLDVREPILLATTQ